MRTVGAPTRYPGVYKVDATTFRVVAKTICPKTGKRKLIERVLQGLTLHEAVTRRAELVAEAATGRTATAERQRVGDFAKFWIECKAPTLTKYTADRYVDALEGHVLPALGNFYIDAVSVLDVQKWINDELREGYRVETVRGWFRILRTMIRDAMARIDLPRDPTCRITFPDEDARQEANALSAAELGAFLTAMRDGFPQHHALAATLAYTGLRFCHVSALRWEDIDDAGGIVHVTRRQVRGDVRPVSKRKRAPRHVPLVPELGTILREHRQRMFAAQAPGFDKGWVFPSQAGTLRTPGGLWKTWRECAKRAGITARFTVHGLRRTFNDLSRRAGADSVVIRSITGHVTERMREHYSTVDLDEKRAVVAGVIGLVRKGMDRGMDQSPKANRPTTGQPGVGRNDS